MPATPSDDNIANVGFVKNTIGAARNIGDFFFTTRNDSSLNGAVACDGSTYNTTDFSGTESIGDLLALGKLPCVSLSTYATLLSTNGSCGVFGWDGVGTTAFRVPSLNDIFIETGTAAQIGDYLEAGAPEIIGKIRNVQVLNPAATGAFKKTSETTRDTGTGHSGGGIADFEFKASDSSAVFGNSNTIQPNAVRYRAMVQLAVGATDEAVETCTQVLADVAANTAAIAGADYVVETQLPTAENHYTWYRKYKSGWIEQGGFETIESASVTSTAASVAITLPVTMADTAYTGIANAAFAGGSSWNGPYKSAATTTKITFSGWVQGTGKMSIRAWEVKGMYAQS